MSGKSSCGNFILVLIELVEMSIFKSVAVLLLLFTYVIAADPEKDDKDSSCSTERAVRIDAPQTDENCESVEGRVQICEEGDWRNLCDTNWTLHDIQVTCRSLNYSTTGKF